MKKEVIGKCPICSEDLEIVRMSCSSCGTAIEGKFKLCRFCSLNSEQKEFVEIFIRNRGNIKEIEKDMGISYPTVKNKLENLIEALGYKTIAKPHIRNKEILERLYNGEITADEAIRMINDQGGE